MIILAPIAGGSPHFSPEDFAYPKPLIEIGGRPMIAWAIENLSSASEQAKFVFVANQAEAQRYSYANIFNLATNGRAQTVLLKGSTGGALCSCLMAIDEIDPTEPLVVANTDQIIDIDLSVVVEQMKAADASAGVVTFESVHPRWSYVATDAEGLVVRASEKEVISKNAIAGFYYFKSAGLFFEAAGLAIRHGVSVNGQYYISSALNEVVLLGGRVAALPVAKERYHSFYDPRNIETFELSRSARIGAGRERRVNVVIPAAGEGRRFAEAGYAKPKPFVDVAGRPMIQRVLDNMSLASSETIAILRRRHIRDSAAQTAELTDRGVRIVEVDELTEGTACTVLLARAHFDNEQPLLIANSDQVVDVKMQAFIDDCFARDLDGSIMVFRDAERNPKWSFAKLDARSLVEEVAEKKPISEFATVGIYFFRRGSAFVSAAIDMIARNDRVNGEFYTCPVYNYMIRAGLRIGVYEVPRDAMHGLGTPEDLAIFLSERNG